MSALFGVCERCSFRYPKQKMRFEASGVLVCFRCYDGEFDRQRHPQNFPARPKKEPKVVPDGRPDVVA